MLVGGPGTGKSVMAATIAGRAQKPLARFGSELRMWDRCTDGSLPAVALMGASGRLEFARTWERFESAADEDMVVMIDKPATLIATESDLERLAGVLVNARAAVVLCEQDQVEAGDLAPAHATWIEMSTEWDVDTDLISFVARWRASGVEIGTQTSTMLRANLISTRPLRSPGVRI